jgi:hypothetical protein
LVFEKRHCDCGTGPKKCPGRCGAWQVEHIFAKSHDFEANDVLENLLPACHRCNCTAFKGNKTLRECVNQLHMNVVTYILGHSELGEEQRQELQAAFNVKPRGPSFEYVSSLCSLLPLPCVLFPFGLYF